MLALVELGKMALQVYFFAMKTAGKTQEEMAVFYAQESDYFVANPPETLPDV